MSVEVYDGGDHWHFVSLGLADMNAASAFELTLRAHRGVSSACPEWPYALLHDLGQYLTFARRPFEAGHYLDLHMPVDLYLGGSGSLSELSFLPDPRTMAAGMHALVVADDPGIDPIEDTPNGTVRFLQLVGVLHDELEALQCWDAGRLTGLLKSVNPQLVTDPARSSVRLVRELESAIREGIATEGSSLTELQTDYLDFRIEHRDGLHHADKVHIQIGASIIEEVQRVLPRRLAFGRPLRVCGPDKTLVFWPGGGTGQRDIDDDSVLYLHVSQALGQAMLRTLRPNAGVYTWPELNGLVVEVVQSNVRDSHGDILRVVG